jgi:hypothetical protein
MSSPFAMAQEFVAQFPNQIAGGTLEITPEAVAKLVFIESVKRLDLRALHYNLTGQKDANGGTKVNLITIKEEWTTEK